MNRWVVDGSYQPEYSDKFVGVGIVQVPLKGVPETKYYLRANGSDSMMAELLAIKYALMISGRGDCILTDRLDIASAAKRCLNQEGFKLHKKWPGEAADVFFEIVSMLEHGGKILKYAKKELRRQSPLNGCYRLAHRLAARAVKSGAEVGEFIASDMSN